MKRRIILGTILILIVGIFSSCKRDRLNPFDPRSVVISDKTKLPEENPNLKNVTVHGDTLYFIYEAGSEKPVYTSGDIVVGEMGGGYLKKVKSTQVKGDTLILSTEQASLTEAVEFGGFEGTVTLVPQSRIGLQSIRIDTLISGKNGEFYHYIFESGQPEVIPLRDSTFQITFPNVQITVRRQDNSIAAIISIDSLVLHQAINVDIGLSIEWFSLREFHLIAYNTNGVDFKNLSMDLREEIHLAEEEIPLGPPIPLGTITFFIGPVPVVIAFELRIDAGTSLDLYLGASENLLNDVGLSLTVGLGAQYTSEGGWSSVHEFSLNGEGQFNIAPSAEISLINKNYVKPNLFANVYRTESGAEIYLKPYQYNELSFPPLSFEGGIGTSAGFSFELRILQWELAEYSRDFVDVRLMKLYEIIPGENNPPNTPSTPSGPSSGNVNVSYTFSSSATDPDGDNVAIRFDWGDGNISNWSNFVSSGQTVSMSHSYASEGTYYVKAQAKDVNGAVSGWSDGWGVVIGEGHWVQNVVGSGNGNFNSVKVGDGRNDGLNRVYAACNDGYIYEFTWNGGNWITESIGYASGGMHDVAIGDVRNDGKDRVYAVDWNGNVFEIEYINGNWVMNTIAQAPSDYMRDIIVGDGRGDGKNRIYTAGGDGHIYEIEWIGNQWVLNDVGAGNHTMDEVTIGDGRGDGTVRVYAACWDNNVYEFEWSGTSWQKNIVGTLPQDATDVFVGDGRGDGLRSLFVTCHDSHVYEYRWNGSTWNVLDMGSGSGSMEDVVIGAVRSDNLPRVYVASWDDNVYEFEWIGTDWTKDIIGSANGNVDDITIGDGKNDGRMRIYIASFDNKIYELEYNIGFW